MAKPFDSERQIEVNRRDRMDRLREHLTYNRSLWAPMLPQKGSAMPRQIQSEVAQLIRRGCVVMTTKTKPAAHGGRQLVSVGPYRTAVGSRGFTLITKHDQLEYGSAITAAKRFIEFVGRGRAGEAALKAANKCLR